MSRSVPSPAPNLIHAAQWVALLMGLACLGTGMWHIFQIFSNLDLHFANHLNRVIHEHIAIRLGFALMLVTFGAYGAWLGRRSISRDLNAIRRPARKATRVG